MKMTPSRQARIKAGYTLEEAARRFSVKPATVAMWERNQVRWAWTYRRALEGARLYGVSVTVFMRCHDPDEKPTPPKKKRAKARPARDESKRSESDT